MMIPISHGAMMPIITSSKERLPLEEIRQIGFMTFMFRDRSTL